jgi:phosphate transport system substrate-binding protein
MVIPGQRWAEEFMAKHPDFSIQVTGGGSGTGISPLTGSIHYINSRIDNGT